MTESNKKDNNITDKQGKALVSLARYTIEKKLGAESAKDDDFKAILDDPALIEKRGTFVTLTKNGSLRGCIGNLAANESIIEGVKRNAINAAFKDFRFSPLKKEELKDINIEVSILTEPKPLDYTDADDLTSKLIPYKDGVIIRKNGASATFLPQVWEQLPDHELFLGHLCVKAGLLSGEWQKGDLEVFTYRAIVYK